MPSETPTPYTGQPILTDQDSHLEASERLPVDSGVTIAGDVTLERGDFVGHNKIIRVSDIHEFHLAIGQYRNYLLALSIRDPERILYLAVSEEAFNRFFTLQFVQQALQFNEVHFLVYAIEEEEIILWQK